MAKKKRKSKAGCHCPRGAKPNRSGGCYRMKGKGKRKHPVGVAKVCRKRKKR